MKQVFSDRVTQFLQCGEENAISAAELTTLAGFRNARDLRKYIAHKRQDVVILSSQKGYFLPSEDREEAMHEVSRYLWRQDARLRSNRLATQTARAFMRENLDSFSDRIFQQSFFD